MSGQMPNALLMRLAERLTQEVPEPVQARASLHLLDWSACAVAGAAEPAGRVLSEFSEGGRVFAWGGLGNLLEMDDVDKRARLHPGPVILPAALIAAAETRADGPAVLCAIARGYEATIRLGRAVGDAHYARFHATATCGPIGAAAACAALFGLDARGTAHAMALAVSMAAGLWHTRHDPQSMGKQLHTAHAARAGYDAARLAAAGFVGPLAILEGEQGFFAGLCPGGEPLHILREESGWRIEEVSFKPWPACRHAHAAIDAALLLRARGPDFADEPIRVETYQDALRFCDRPEPKTPIEAKFSLQHAVAVTLLRGAPKLGDFSSAALADAQIADMRRRVVVSLSPAYEAAYPARFGAAVMAGTERAAIPDALGDPENPVTTERLMEKARMLMEAGGLPEEEAERLIRLATAPPESLDAQALIGALKETLS